MHLPWSPAPFLARFLRDERGSIAIEAMIVMPILIWCIMGTHVFFDGYRAQSVNLKAAYTIGDALSRETNPITPEYMDSLFRLQGRLTNVVGAHRRIRVTAVRFRTPSTYEVCWSQTRGGGSALTNATLQPLRPRLPIMSNLEMGILIETWVDYAPDFAGTGIDPFAFSDLVFTSPRFADISFGWSNANDGWTQANTICVG